MKHRILLVLITMALALAGAAPARGTVAAAPDARPLARIRIAFTQHNNVYITNADGSGRTVVTTRGSATGIHYPWYQWSPDGKYLLLLRDQSAKGDDLLLMDQEGDLLRTLLTNLDRAGNYPRWAADSDQIAFTGSPSATPQGQSTVSRMDVSGRYGPLWTYTQYEGCDLDPTMTRFKGSGQEDPSWGLAIEQLAPVFEWSVGRHQAIYSAGCRGLDFTDTQSGATHSLPDWTDVAVSRSGAVAAAVDCGGSSQCIALVDPRSGSVIRVLTPGIEPLWSRNGSVLYFVRQIPGQSLNINQGDSQPYNNFDMTTASSAIWKIDANGTHLARLVNEDAYAFTSLQLSPDGHSIVFSQVDNPWAIWSHRSSGNVVSFEMFSKYFPQISIQRLNLATGKVTTIIRDAGMPAVQP